MQLNWLHFIGIILWCCDRTRLTSLGCKLQPRAVFGHNFSWLMVAGSAWNHQSICMSQLQPLCSAALVSTVLPRRDEGSGKPCALVQWSKPHSIIAPLRIRTRAAGFKIISGDHYTSLGTTSHLLRTRIFRTTMSRTRVFIFTTGSRTMFFILTAGYRTKKSLPPTLLRTFSATARRVPRISWRGGVQCFQISIPAQCS